jgi:uncharacterized ferritin-like protein (DUF455 family)
MPASLISGAHAILHESDPWRKEALTIEIVNMWKSGDLPLKCSGDEVLSAPNEPARNNLVKVVAPRDMPKLGKGGTISSRQVLRIHCLEWSYAFSLQTSTFEKERNFISAPLQAIIHSLTHIESCAVDLAWDIIVRFGCNMAYELPRAFFDDFVLVAEDECRHFSLLATRLKVSLQTLKASTDNALSAKSRVLIVLQM